MILLFSTNLIHESEALIPIENWGNLYIISSHRYALDPHQAYRHQRLFRELYGPNGSDLVNALGDGRLVFTNGPTPPRYPWIPESYEDTRYASFNPH